MQRRKPVPSPSSYWKKFSRIRLKGGDDDDSSWKIENEIVNFYCRFTRQTCESTSSLVDFIKKWGAKEATGTNEFTFVYARKNRGADLDSELWKVLLSEKWKKEGKEILTRWGRRMEFILMHRVMTCQFFPHYYNQFFVKGIPIRFSFISYKETGPQVEGGCQWVSDRFW